MKRETVAWILAGALLVAAVIAGQLAMGAKWDQSVAAANLKAANDTVRVYKDSTNTLTTAAAVMQFQIPNFNVTDSLAKVNGALGMATRDLSLTNKALTKAQVAFEAVLADYTHLVEMTVVSPQGRPERLAAFTLKDTIANPLIEGEIVVTVPSDTAIPIELTTRLRPRDFTIVYGLGCTPQREAVAAFETPAGIVALPQKGQVDPVVCHGTRPNLLSFELTMTPLGLGVGTAIGLAAGILIAK